MKPFLRHIAEDLYSKYGNRLADIAIIFPNKRAGLFFNEYLKQLSDTPIWCPVYKTIGELFNENSDSVEGDPIELVSILHKEYCKATGSTETLDKFYYWGEILVKDFDEIDKNLVDAERLFSNLSDLYSYGTAADTLDEEQRQAIEQFFHNFKGRESEGDAPDEENTLKERFLTIWEALLPIYTNFRTRLRERSIAYPGMLCRDVIENRENLEFPHEKYIFAGFNALNRCEEAIFDILQQQGKAYFYWDYDTAYIDNPSHEAGRFMKENLKRYPNEITAPVYDNLGKEKNITFVAATTENIQTRHLYDLLTGIPENKELETAVVLCNEEILEQVLHSIPPAVKNINITMGYPVTHTPAYSFMKLLADLHINGYDNEHGTFRYEAAAAILKHPYTALCSENAIALMKGLTKDKDYFPSLTRLHADQFLKKIFTLPADNIGWITAVRDIIHTITNAAPDSGEESYEELFRESLFSIYTQAQRVASLLESGEIELQLRTLTSLFMRVIGGLSLPFHGEPVVGLQIMGLLETRNLDFRNLILLSANEGNLPRKNSSNSLIPHNLRRAFGLMLTEQRNAVYTYNFYRLIQRAENITMMYNNTLDAAGQGERSRYMMQMLVNRKERIKEIILTCKQKTNTPALKPQAKDKNTIKKLRRIFDTALTPNALTLSPSGINRYIECPMRFFYYYIADLKAQQEVESTIQSADFGNIFHKAAELFYDHITKESGSSMIQKSHLEPYIEKDAFLYPFIDKAFRKCFFKSDEKEELKFDGMQYINREILHRCLLRLIRIDAAHTPFEYIGSEKEAKMTMTTVADGETVSLSVGGRVDRMDRKGDTIEIVDYKTGGSPDKDKTSDVQSLFARKGKRSAYMFQTLLYSAAVKATYSPKEIAPSLLYILKRKYTTREEFIVKMNSEPITDYHRYHDEFMAELQRTIDEIFDIGIPFTHTEDSDRCTFCDYRQLCGK